MLDSSLMIWAGWLCHHDVVVMQLSDLSQGGVDGEVAVSSLPRSARPPRTEKVLFTVGESKMLRDHWWIWWTPVMLLDEHCDLDDDLF